MQLLWAIPLCLDSSKTQNTFMGQQQFGKEKDQFIGGGGGSIIGGKGKGEKEG
jgi:hypothetical protein